MVEIKADEQEVHEDEDIASSVLHATIATLVGDL